MTRKVAIVTGSNRGIGFAVVRSLLREFHGDVYLTARNKEKGHAACEKLRLEGLKPLFHELDISQPASIRMLQEFIEEKYGGVDILVNNAAVLFGKGSNAPLLRQVEQTMETNFKGTLCMCTMFLPMMKPHGRIVVMSSEAGNLSRLGNDIRAKINVNTVDMSRLEKLANLYVTAVKADVAKEHGWPEQPSHVAYTFLNVMVKYFSQKLQNDPRRNILINACSPGWTLTDSTKPNVDAGNNISGEVPRTPDEAAADVVSLALIPQGTPSPNGELVHIRKVVNFF